MEQVIEKRIGISSLVNKIVSAEDAAALIQDGDIVGMSGFTRAGDAKVVPLALAQRAKMRKLKLMYIRGFIGA